MTRTHNAPVDIEREVFQGESFTFAPTLTGGGLDWTLMTSATMAIRSRESAKNFDLTVTVLAGDMALTPESAKVPLTFTAEQTAQLEPRQYFWGVSVVLGSTSVVILNGKLTVKNAVT